MASIFNARIANCEPSFAFLIVSNLRGISFSGFAIPSAYDAPADYSNNHQMLMKPMRIVHSRLGQSDNRAFDQLNRARSGGHILDAMGVSKPG